MADAEDFGERAATAQEAADWVTLVRQARAASRGDVARPGQPDRMRPTFGSGKASSEGDD